MKQLYIIAPALIPTAYMLGMFGVYCVRKARGWRPQVDGIERRRFTELFGPFLIGYFLWLIQPIERAVVAARISPNLITCVSLALCATSGVAAAGGFLALAAWAYIAAGMLDVLDGRLARATGRQSQAGAFLDSVSDRWGELFVLSGFAWFLRDTPWLGAVMLAVAGSMMVSYTRARGEGLGLNLDGGTMQRAERIALVSIGSLATAILLVAESTAGHAVHVIGSALLITGAASTATSIGRWVQGYRVLAARERKRVESSSVVIPASPVRRQIPVTAERSPERAGERAGERSPERERAGERAPEPSGSPGSEKIAAA